MVLMFVFVFYKKNYSQTVPGLADQVHVHISCADG